MNFDPITYNEAHLLREHFKLIYGSYDATAFLFDASITAASLETWLGTPANLAAFQQMLTTYIGPSALIANTATWAAVVGSSTAMAQVAASTITMDTVVASKRAMNSVVASSTALMAIHAQDIALNIISGSATAMAAMRASAKYLATVAQAFSGPATINSLNAAGTYILLGLASNNAPSGTAIAVYTLRSGSTIANTGLKNAVVSSNVTNIDLAVPLVSPYTATVYGGYNWYFGVIRCDI